MWPSKSAIRSSCTPSGATRESLGSVTTAKGEWSPMKVIDYKNRAFELGRVSAVYNLALAFERGKGVPEDIQRSNKYYQKAAAKGYACSIFSLVNSLSKGRGEVDKLFSSMKQKE